MLSMAYSSMNAPTDYGVINFIRNRREAKADFLRVPDNILVPKLLKLMVRQWRLAKPSQSQCGHFGIGCVSFIRCGL